MVDKNFLFVWRRMRESGLYVKLKFHTPYCGWYLGTEFLDEMGVKADVFWRCRALALALSIFRRITSMQEKTSNRTACVATNYLVILLFMINQPRMIAGRMIVKSIKPQNSISRKIVRFICLFLSW